MLKKITIKNLAIVNEINLNFSKGLNVITGETGSGKSIIVNAVELLIGGKFNKENFRNNNDAEISGICRHHQADFHEQWAGMFHVSNFIPGGTRNPTF